MDYEAEHNLPPNTTTAPAPKPTRRPDLTSFYASLANVQVPAGASAAVEPIPAHVAAAAALYGDALRMSLTAGERALAGGPLYHHHGGDRGAAAAGEAEGEGAGELEDEDAPQMRATVDLLRDMLARVSHLADDPPRRVEGVPDAFLDGLERVGRGRLRKADKCPICAEPFLDDKFPLVVCLPCDDRHWFDYECIRPWLKLNPTCPLDRKDLLKKKEPAPVEDDEGDPDDYFA